MSHEPTWLEMFLTKLALLLCGKSVYKTFADHLQLSGAEQVLDFGCGMGTVAYYAIKRLPQGQLTCLDISERWLKACRKTLRKCDNVSFVNSDTSALKDNSFDLVYCHFVLHDISEGELESVIPALAKSLKQDGALVFREPLSEANKLNIIKRLLLQNGLAAKDNRVVDIPIMGNALESIYIKIK